MRVFENEDDLAEALAKRGVIILTAEEGKLGDMLASLLDAQVLISVEGSQQITHCSGSATKAPSSRFSRHIGSTMWLRTGPSALA